MKKYIKVFTVVALVLCAIIILIAHASQVDTTQRDNLVSEIKEDEDKAGQQAAQLFKDDIDK